MGRTRTEIERAAGKLISAIQKEWTSELGKPEAEVSEEVMHTSHDLLQAAKAGSLPSLLSGRSVANYLGKDWVRTHPGVLPFIEVLEAQITREPRA
jgi:hypothetical protein